MMNTNPQSNGQPQVQAVVLGFGNDVSESAVQHYPEADQPQQLSISEPVKKEGKAPEGEPYLSPSAPASRPPTTPSDFSSGICDFHQSWMICADAYCCSYCVASAHHNYLINEQEGIFWPVCCGLFCVDAGLQAISPYLPTTLCFHTCFMRYALRQRYNLHSDTPAMDADSAAKSCNAESLMDVLTVFCCLSCTIAQHQREIIRRGEWAGGVLSNRHSLDAPGAVYAE